MLVDTTDGDTFLEPGETGTVDVPVTNDGDATALLVNVQLRSSTPGVTIQPAIHDYGDIDVGATAVRSFSVTAPAAARPGSVVALTSTVTFAGGYSPLTTEGRLVIGQPSTEPVQAFYTGPPVVIPDNDPAGVSVPLTLNGVGAVSGGVTFSIDGTACTATAREPADPATTCARHFSSTPRPGRSRPQPRPTTPTPGSGARRSPSPVSRAHRPTAPGCSPLPISRRSTPAPSDLSP
jgi:hypothetical protein